MNSSGTCASGMAQQEVAWLRVRGRDGERQVKKKLRVSLRHLAAMDLDQFQQFLKEKLELERSLTVSYSDDEGDEIPVTSDDELSVMVYMAEILARQGCALELRLRHRRPPTAPAAPAAPALAPAAAPAEDRSLTSARQLAKRTRAERRMAAKTEEMQRRGSERRRCALHPHRLLEDLSPEMETGPLPAAPCELHDPEPSPCEIPPMSPNYLEDLPPRHEMVHREKEPRPPPAAPSDPLWARVDAWQQGCLSSGGGELTPEDWWAPPQTKRPIFLQQPGRSRRHPPPPPPPPPPLPGWRPALTVQGPPPLPLPQEPPVLCRAGHVQTQQAPAPARTKERSREPPAWFTSFMSQFQKDLVSGVVDAVKAELARGPGCLCAAVRTADTETDQASGSSGCVAEPAESISAEEGGPTTQTVPLQTEPARSGETSPPSDSSWVATFPASDPIPIPGSAPAPAPIPVPAPAPVLSPAPAPEVITSDAGVQTAGSAAAPVDLYGLFSVHSAATPPAGSVPSVPSLPSVPSDSADSRSGPQSGSGVFSGSGHSVTSSGSGHSVTGGSGYSVTGVHTGVTVYSSGGGSVEIASAEGNNNSSGGSSGGRPALLRTAYSVPASRPRPRPRRQLTIADDADFSGMLVMVEHSATELEPLLATAETAAGDAGAAGSAGAAAGSLVVGDGVVTAAMTEEDLETDGTDGDPQPSQQAPTQQDTREDQREESQEQEQSSQQQEQGPPVTETQWRASEPPMPPPPPPPPAAADAVEEPKLETSVKRPAAGHEPAPQAVQHVHQAPDQDSELEEGYVTVNGHRLSLSEDDFSDIVIISSPGGSERFEMVEEVPTETEEEGTETEQREQPPQEVMAASALSERWVDAPATLEASGSAGSISGWAGSSAGSELLRSTCESAPAACPIEITCTGNSADRTKSLPAGVKLHPVSAAPGQPSIPEQPARQEPQDQDQEPGPVSLMDPLSQLSGPLRRRLIESLQLMPEPRQRQLAADMTGRRSVESFWERLCDSATVSNSSPMSALLADQAARPAGVGLLADSLDNMLRHIKVSASSSSELDGMGAQAVKHALCLLRDGVRRDETTGEGSGVVTGEETTPGVETDGQEMDKETGKETVEQETAVKKPVEQETGAQERSASQERAPEGPRQERVQEVPQQERPEEALHWERMFHQSSQSQSSQSQSSQSQSQFQQQQQQGQHQGSYQQQFSSDQTQSPPPSSGPEDHQQPGAAGVPSWLAGLAGLLPDGVLNILRHSHRSTGRETVPTEAEALMISRLVEMGFFDLDRMRELYREFGDDCNMIASHLLDGQI